MRLEPNVYIILNKPRGPLSAVRDQRGRQTVLDLIGAMTARLYPAGRLDADTEGLLLITNDGDLTYRLTHPRFEVEKVYEAEVKGRPSPLALRRLAEGVVLDDGPTGPAKVRMLSDRELARARDGAPAIGGETSVVELIIHSGRKRQVRRMLRAVGHPVVRLRRTRVGPLRLEGLRPGEWRLLGSREIAELRGYLARREAPRARMGLPTGPAPGLPGGPPGQVPAPEVKRRARPCPASGTWRRPERS